MDNHYTFTKMMGLRLSVVAIPIVFGIVSVGVYSASAAAALSVLVIFLLYLCFLTYSYVSNRFHLSMLQRRVAFAVFGFVMLTGFVFAIGAYASNEHQLSFAAGTIAWSVPAIVLALYVVTLYYFNNHLIKLSLTHTLLHDRFAFGTWYNRTDRSVYCSNAVYPVLHFGQNNQIEDTESATNATYMCLLMIIIWGGFCAINGEAAIEVGALAMSGGFVLMVYFTMFSVLESKGDIAASLSILRLVTLLSSLETRQDVVDTLDKKDKTVTSLPPLYRCLQQSHQKARGIDVLDDVGEIFPSTGLRGMLSTLKTALSNADDEIKDQDQDDSKQAGDDDESKSDGATFASSSSYESRIQDYVRSVRACHLHN